VWLRREGTLFTLSQASHGFALMAETARPKGERPVFWLPDYFCDDALQSLRETGADLVFYPVNADMNPDWAACELLGRSQKPDFFVLVHYFGQCANVRRARDFCDRYQARLVEDATHVLQPAGDIGGFGDFALFSPRKFFDIPNGGIMTCHDPQASKRIGEHLHLCGPPEGVDLRRVLKDAERAFRRHVLRRKPKAHSVPPRLLETVNPMVPLFPGIRMGRYSKSRIAREISSCRIETLGAQRAGFEERVCAKLDPDVTPIAGFGDAVSCWLGLACENETIAQATMDRLRQENIVAAPWPNRLPPEVLNDSGHQLAKRLRNTNLLASFR
jgi:hypothetical protein